MIHNRNTRRSWLLIALAAILLFLYCKSDGHAQSTVAPKRYALLVAVNKYEDSKLNQPPLQFPESDAKEIGERLLEGGYEVDFLIGSNATKLAIERKLASMNQKGNDEGAVVIGFFGHGVEYQGTDEAMFCPYDGTAKGVFSTWDAIQAKDGYVFTAPVGRFRGNGLGLQDMHGNVREWCSDVYDSYEGSNQTDPKGPGVKEGSDRVNRGGGWGSTARYCRSTYRDGDPPVYRRSGLGFRVSLVPASK